MSLTIGGYHHAACVAEYRCVVLPGLDVESQLERAIAWVRSRRSQHVSEVFLGHPVYIKLHLELLRLNAQVLEQTGIRVVYVWGIPLRCRGEDHVICVQYSL